MDVILIPGFWLGADSWERVTPLLEEAGHRVHPVTLPGLESVDADRSGITLDDHVAAVVTLVDELAGAGGGVAAAGRVVLVGHSGGGTVADGVVDARPDRVERVVYVDAGPQPDGEPINDVVPEVDGEIPLPDWSEFGDGELVDLDDDLRTEFRARAVPQPLRVARDGIRLADPRRHEVPITVICCEFTSDALRGWLADGLPFTSELAQRRDVSYVDLPTGHWPQFTKPVQLGQVLVAALR